MNQIVFHAFGVVSYDKAKSAYEFRAYAEAEISRPKGACAGNGGNRKAILHKPARGLRFSAGMKKLVQKVYLLGYGCIVFLFLCCGFSLIVYAALELWSGINPGSQQQMVARFHSLLEGVGLLTIAVAALELAKTIQEEEIVREAQMSAPTRVRRFLSRFLVVVIVALSIECLIAVFQFVHEAPAQLPQAAAIGVAAGVLLIAWGGFIRLNKEAEELEPEGIEEARKEDHKVG